MRARIRIPVYSLVAALLTVGSVVTGFAQDVAVILGNTLAVTAAEGDQSWPFCAADTVNHRFLVVWIDTPATDPTTNHVFGQVLNSDGTPYSGAIPLAPADNAGDWWPNCVPPPLSFNSVDQRFLVAWGDRRYGDSALLGQLVNANGTLSGMNFAVSPTYDESFGAYRAIAPALAFDPDNNRWLVVWRGGPWGGTPWWGICGQLVNANGSLYGSLFQISTQNPTDYTFTATSPSAVYDTTHGRYLVTWVHWEDSLENHHMDGRLVSSEGGLLGSEVRMSLPWAGAQPTLVWDSVNDNCLQILYKRGEVLQCDGTPLRTNFQVNARTSGQTSAVFDPLTRRYLAVADTGDFSAKGQLLTPEGTLEGKPFVVATNIFWENSGVSAFAAFDASSRKGLLVWCTAGGWGMGTDDIRGRPFSVHPRPRIRHLTSPASQISLAITNLPTYGTNHVESCHDLQLGGWSNVPLPIIGVSATIWTTALPAAPASFWRVRSEVP